MAPVAHAGGRASKCAQNRPVQAPVHGTISRDLCELLPKRSSAAVHQPAEPARKCRMTGGQPKPVNPFEETSHETQCIDIEEGFGLNVGTGVLRGLCRPPEDRRSEISSACYKKKVLSRWVEQKRVRIRARSGSRSPVRSFPHDGRHYCANHPGPSSAVVRLARISHRWYGKRPYLVG